jgi:hypothetical protein
MFRYKSTASYHKIDKFSQLRIGSHTEKKINEIKIQWHEYVLYLDDTKISLTVSKMKMTNKNPLERPRHSSNAMQVMEDTQNRLKMQEEDVWKYREIGREFFIRQTTLMDNDGDVYKARNY